MIILKLHAGKRRIVPAVRRLAIVISGCVVVSLAATPLQALEEFYVVKVARADTCKVVTLPPTTTEEKLLAGGRLFGTREEAAAEIAKLSDCGAKDTNVGQAPAPTLQSSPHAVARARSSRKPVRSARQNPARPAPSAEVSAANNRPFFWFGGNW